MVAKTELSSKKKTTAAVGLKPPKTPKDVSKMKSDSKSSKTKNTKTNDNSKLDGHSHRLMTGINVSLVEKATEALIQYHEKTQSSTNNNNSKKTDLLGSDRQIFLQFTMLRTPQVSSKKPTRIMIPHPLFQLASNGDKDSSTHNDDLEEPEVCLIVKEESKPWVQDMITRFPDEMGCIKKVLGLQSLRTKHARYEQRRALLHKYNVFMADDRILPMLSKALGSDFYKAKKLPLPITLTRKEALPFTIQRALNATYLSISKGTCFTIRAGTTGMTCQQLTENITEIVKGTVPHVPQKWANIQNISIKTPESVSLPIYNKTPEVLREIAAAAGVVDEVDDAIGSKIDTPEKDVDAKIPQKVTPTSEKKREMTSPLLRALKKQKVEDAKIAKKQAKEKTSNEKEGSSDSSKSSKKKESPNDAKETTKSTHVIESNEASTSEKKRQTESPLLRALKKQKEEETTSKTKQSKKEKRPDEKTDDASKKMVTPKDAKKETSKSSNKETSASSTKESGDFIAAKKFIGSKTGYVFRMGKEGLGYYVDIQPKIDNMKMEALMRAGKSKGQPRGQNTGKKGRKSW